MPARIERREGETLQISGVTVGVALARGKRAVLVIEGYDGCGLLEGEAAVRAALVGYHRRLDESQVSGKTTGIEVDSPSDTQ